MVIIAYRSDLNQFRITRKKNGPETRSDFSAFFSCFLSPGTRSLQGGFAGQKRVAPDRTSDFTRSYAERTNTTTGREKHSDERKEETRK